METRLIQVHRNNGGDVEYPIITLRGARGDDHVFKTHITRVRVLHSECQTHFTYTTLESPSVYNGAIDWGANTLKLGHMGSDDIHLDDAGNVHACLREAIFSGCSQ